MPRKKSENLKLLEGTSRSDRQKNNPKPKPVFPANPPRGLVPKTAVYARQFWKQYASKLESLGLAREVDIPAFYTMAMTWQTIRECEELIAQQGVLVPGARGQEMVKNPAVSVLNAARQQFRLQCARFGMDPDSREKISVAVEEDPEDELEQLFRERRNEKAKF